MYWHNTSSCLCTLFTRVCISDYKFQGYRDHMYDFFPCIFDASPEVNECCVSAFWWGVKQRKKCFWKQTVWKLPEKAVQRSEGDYSSVRNCFKEIPSLGEWFSTSLSLSSIQMLPWGSAWGGIISVTTYEDFCLKQWFLLVLAEMSREWPRKDVTQIQQFNSENPVVSVLVISC